ncbi:MAG: DUF6456 domain-containing protein [Pseudomonadota bacterium]
MSEDNHDRKKVLRLLRFLSTGVGCVESETENRAGFKMICIANAVGKKLNLESSVVQQAISKELIGGCDGNLHLTQPGRAHLKRSLSQVDEFGEQHRELGQRQIIVDNAPHLVVVNSKESPLTRLMKLRSANGDTFLSKDEFEAGERFRSLYSRAGLLNGLSSNWSVTMRSGSKGTSAKGSDPTDCALDARVKVNAAIQCAGPLLSGTIVDLCCHLKKFEQVERERRWPPRSAKHMLKAALSVLAPHFGISHKQSSDRSSSRIRHWAEEGYRPDIG